MGACRVWLVRDERATQATIDDTLAAARLRMGDISASDLSSIPYIVLSSLGLETPPKPSRRSLDLRHGDALVLCTDGLRDLPATTISDATRHAPDAAADALIEAALMAGSTDNLGVVVAEPLAPGRE